ncbi:hypothetical protein QCA50_003577 [Cerrena zonata]|uniref:Uncharacterized protein n=1 Tax=Cerrena zonata TaxID=2478898 RepID=A0AAW0GML0_9APHY
MSESPSPPQRSSNRQSTAPPSSRGTRQHLKTKPKEEYFMTLAETPGINISNIDKAAKYLHSNGLVDRTKPPSLDTLICGLLWIATQQIDAKHKGEIVDTIRSFAFYADAIQKDIVAENLLELATPRLTAMFNATETKLTEAADQHASKIGNITTQMEDVLQKTKNILDAQHSANKEATLPLETLIDKVTDRLDAIEKKIEVGSFISRQELCTSLLVDQLGLYP